MTQTQKNPKKNYSEEELKVLMSISKKLNKFAEPTFHLRSGILRGVGFAIGASIIGAVIVSIVVAILQWIDPPLVNEVIDSATDYVN